MNRLRAGTDLGDSLSNLRAESLSAIALLSGAIGYFWLVWSVWPQRAGSGAPFAGLSGSGLLIAGASVAFVLRGRRLGFASGLLIASQLVGVCCAVVDFRSLNLNYLLVLPVVFGSVLLAQIPALLVATSSSILIIVLTTLGVGTRPFLADAFLPLVVIALTAAALWFSVRHLLSAIAWFLDEYERARKSEQAARDTQGQLARTLKALEEASHRVMRANYVAGLARDQAEEARRLKQQFVQNISHELRTPLNLIIGFIELMAQSPQHYGGPLPPSYLRDLDIVYRNAQHLHSLVNDVLDLARIEAAHMTLTPETADPAVLVRQAVDTARSLVEGRGLEMRLEIEPDLPKLWVDTTRIRQVLFNLLNNAARFTTLGSVAVEVCSRGETVLFSVADTGAGIAAQDLPRVFEEFSQIDGSMRRRHGGAGIGLSISKEFVELHGGSIWAESEVGRGSTFYFSLPVAGAVPETAPTLRIPESGRPVLARVGQEPVLLVVTDSPYSGALLTRYARRCRTVVVPSLAQARQVAGQIMPQVVIVDHAQNGVDEGSLETLAKEWDLPNTAFVCCSLPGEDRLRHEVAADGYLIKPVSLDSLRDLLRQFGETAEKVLVVDDEPDFVRMMRRMLADPLRRYEVDTASTGREALAIMRRRKPDLVLLDLVLPDISGYQVIQEVRARPSWRDITLVAVSGQDAYGQEVLVGKAATIVKAAGLRPRDFVGLVQHLLDTTVSLSPAPATPQAEYSQSLA